MSGLFILCQPRLVGQNSIRHSRVILNQRGLSSQATQGSQIRADPSKLIAGIDEETFKNNPLVAAYVRANFPEAFLEGSVEKVDFKKDRRNSSIPPPLNIRSMFSYKRDMETEDGSRAARRLRYQGLVPGVIYGDDPQQGVSHLDRSSLIFIKTPTKVVDSELARCSEFNSFQSRVYDLTVYESHDDETGVVHRVLPRSVQRHPVNEAVYCTNFLRYFPGRPIKIPIKLINEEESPALKRDGFLVPINKYVECTVEDGIDIPEILEVECTGVRYKEVLRLDRVIFPDGVKPTKKVVKNENFVLGPIFGGRGGEAGGEAAAEDDE